MTDKQIKVGDVVAWRDVPEGALVLVQQERYQSFWLRLDDELGFQVGFMLGFNKPTVRLIWSAVCPRDPTDRRRAARATIIALNVPAHASAADLRRLAEVFEVRESLFNMPAGNHAAESAIERCIRAATKGQTFGDLNEAFCAIAERLHAAGWRPGMTAEDAARLLAEDRS